MAQIINEYRGLGNALGTGLGQGFSESLKQLSQHKLDALKSQYSEKILEDTDIDPVAARFINSLPAKDRLGVITEYFKQKEIQGQEQPQGNLQQMLSPQPEQQQGPQQLGGLASLFNNGLSGGGINPQFLQQLQQMQQQPQQPQMQEQVAPPAEQQPPLEKPKAAGKSSDLLKKALTSGRATSKDNSLKERALDFKESQATNTFIKAVADQYHEYKNVGDIAQRAKKLLERNIKKWPGALRGNLTGKAQALFERDPAVREYQALANEVVTAKAKTGRGVPSRARLLLEEAAKANLSQPVKTQRAIWDRLIKDADDKQKILKDALGERDSKTGKYPLDLISRTLEKELARDFQDFEESEMNPIKQTVSNLADAKQLKDGDIAVNKKTGQVRRYSAAKKDWVNE